MGSVIPEWSVHLGFFLVRGEVRLGWSRVHVVTPRDTQAEQGWSSLLTFSLYPLPGTPQTFRSCRPLWHVTNLPTSTWCRHWGEWACRGQCWNLLSHWLSPHRKVRKPSWAEVGASQGPAVCVGSRAVTLWGVNSFSGGWETLSLPLDLVAHVQKSGSLWFQCLGDEKGYFWQQETSILSAHYINNKVTLL